MKKSILLGLLTIACLSFTSCNNENSAVETEVTHYEASDIEKKLDAKLADILAQVATYPNDNYSLNYRNEAGITYTAVERLSQDNKVLIYELNSTIGDQSAINKTTFYMNGAHPFITIERFDNTEKVSVPEFIERISYYDEKGKVLKSKLRKAGSEDELEEVEFTPTKNHAISLDLVKDIMARKGNFELTFQGFILSENALDFIMVGAPGKDGFSSAIQIEHYDSFINEAKKNQEKYLNRKVNIQFHIEEVNGYEYQVYNSGAWVE